MACNLTSKLSLIQIVWRTNILSNQAQHLNSRNVSKNMQKSGPATWLEYCYDIEIFTKFIFQYPSAATGLQTRNPQISKSAISKTWFEDFPDNRLFETLSFLATNFSNLLQETFQKLCSATKSFKLRRYKKPWISKWASPQPEFEVFCASNWLILFFAN